MTGCVFENDGTELAQSVEFLLYYIFQSWSVSRKIYVIVIDLPTERPIQHWLTEPHYIYFYISFFGCLLIQDSLFRTASNEPSDSSVKMPPTLNRTNSSASSTHSYRLLRKPDKTTKTCDAGKKKKRNAPSKKPIWRNSHWKGNTVARVYSARLTKVWV